MSSRAIARVERKVAGVISSLPSARRQRLLVAVSGGPDSVAALHALCRTGRWLNFELAAAHLNHGIRRAEADRDELFVRELCSRLGTELVVEEIRGLGPKNFEERARELRYEFLNRAAGKLNAQSIVVGHHQDDQAETVLLRLVRGSGIAGLAAMAELGPGRLVRPLLSLARVEILAYLTAIGANYVIDSTNLEQRALRNRIRAGLLPQLERDYSPGIGRRLAELATEMRDLGSFVQQEACKLLERLRVDGGPNCWGRMDVRGFASISPALARAVIREFIRLGVGDLRRIGRVHIEAMRRVAAGSTPSAAVSLPRGWRFRREYDTVMLEQIALPTVRTGYRDDRSGCTLLMCGKNRLNGFILTMQEIAAGEPSFPCAPWHPHSRFEAYFDADPYPTLAARCFRPGDRIRPLGLRGHRKVQDVFVDQKVAVAKRRSWPLVVSGEEVLWIPGLVRSGAALVTEATKRILHFRADSLPGDQKL
jgi:tRNA(Ile)-lysidine synthase